MSKKPTVLMIQTGVWVEEIYKTRIREVQESNG